MSDDLGRLLKAAREERGLSLDDLQEMTKIQKRYIDAIETGKYHLLPGPFYTRAFIRNISENLHLNTDQLLQQYEGTLPATHSEPVDSVPRRKNRITGPSVIGKWISTFLLVAFVVLIFSIVYYFTVKNFPPSDQTKSKENSIDVVDKMANKPPVEVVEVTPVTPTVEEPKAPETPMPELSFVETVGNTHFYKIANVKVMDLKMKAEGGRCWFQIEKGKGKGVLKEGILNDGSEDAWNLEGLSNVYIRLGHAKVMKVEINGQLIDTSSMRDTDRIDITLIPLLGD